MPNDAWLLLFEFFYHILELWRQSRKLLLDDTFSLYEENIRLKATSLSFWKLIHTQISKDRNLHFFFNLYFLKIIFHPKIKYICTALYLKWVFYLIKVNYFKPPNFILIHLDAELSKMLYTFSPYFTNKRCIYKFIVYCLVATLFRCVCI